MTNRQNSQCQSSTWPKVMAKAQGIPPTHNLQCTTCMNAFVCMCVCMYMRGRHAITPGHVRPAKRPVVACHHCSLKQWKLVSVKISVLLIVLTNDCCSYYYDCLFLLLLLLLTLLFLFFLLLLHARECIYLSCCCL